MINTAFLVHLYKQVKDRRKFHLLSTVKVHGVDSLIIVIHIYLPFSFVVLGSQQGLQGEAAYRLGLAYEMTGDGKTALLVSLLFNIP